MELDSLYQEVILEHYKRPQNKGLLPNQTVQVHHVNTSCGDEITLNLKLTNGVISEISWDGVGCSISQASTSVVSELLKGKSSDAALSVIETFQAMLQSKGSDRGDESILEDGVAFAGVAKFPARVKCALLGWMATKDAISQSLALTGNNAKKEQK
ncbi:MAG: SUF system NifU family Fe-S cluster assembly protein [Candidatus Nanopelagicaceae bacterium]|nr:SUF system NifU family Fe-S cluster assembly protein [Candidatus Nanopelagicaceae bacterium]